jgi:hypothetical protein
MLTGEMARLRIEDRVRDAESDRMARSTRAGREREARSSGRRVVRTLAAALLWPVKH